MTADLAIPARTHTGQATQIEQARAQAEVLAAMEAAKRWPRDEDACEAKMRRACARPLVADKAFWAFPRAGEQLTGSTIHLATTLAGIWGNMQFGVVELERNTARRESQMLAVAWELETNTRATTTFLVPHVRDTRKGPRDLTELRDVYENNANQGARRVREMIFKILPDWYTESAEDICRATLERSDKPITEQRAAIAKAFETLAVTVDQLATKVGRDWDDTRPADLAILRIVGKSIRRGETTVREQFPPVAAAPPPVTAEELTRGAPAPAQPEPAPEEPADEAGPIQMLTEFPPVSGSGDDPPASRAVQTTIARVMAKGGVTADADRYAIAARLAGRTKPVASTGELTAAEGKQVVVLLTGWQDAGILTEQMDAVRAAIHDGEQSGPREDVAEQQDIPDPETDPEGWHRDGHPRQAPDGSISRVPAMATDACQWCAP